MVTLAWATRDVGICDRKIHDRSHLVVLPLLAAEISRRTLRHKAGAGLSSVDRDIGTCRCRLSRRRLAFECVDQAWIERKRCAKDGDARGGDSDSPNNIRPGSKGTLAQR